MNSVRSTIFLLIACCTSGMLLWVIHRPVVQRGAAIVPGRRLIESPLREIDYLALERDGWRVELRRDVDGWQLTHPVVARANRETVQRLLDACERVRVLDRIDAHELALRELSPVDFGLLAAEVRLLVAGPRMRVDLLLGNRTPVSNEQFATLEGAGDVLVVTANLMDALPTMMHDLRDRSLYHGNSRRIVSLSLRRPSSAFVRLSRAADGWRLSQPVNMRADNQVVQRILDELNRVQIARFVWSYAPETASDATPTSPSVAGFGLAEQDAAVQMQVWEAGNPVGQRYLFGRSVEGLPDHYHAMMPDGLAVVAITGSLRRAVMQPLDALIEKRPLPLRKDAVLALEVFNGAHPLALRCSDAGKWEFTAPVIGPADDVAMADFLGALTSLRAVKFEEIADSTVRNAATNGDLRLSLTTSDRTWQLLIPHDVRQHGELSPVKIAGVPWSYLVPTSSVARVTAGLHAPHVLFDRRLISVSPGKIRRVHVRHSNGRVEQVERDAADGWRGAFVGQNPDRELLQTWLLRLSTLKAREVVGFVMNSSIHYGFEFPWLEISIELAADDVLRRVLSIGDALPDGGRFAMVKGGDVIYVLAPDDVELLEKSLLLRPPQESGAPSSSAASTDPRENP